MHFNHWSCGLIIKAIPEANRCVSFCLCVFLSMCGSVCASELSHTTLLSPNRHTTPFNTYEIWLR